jgi:hypothetical protein
MLRRRRHAQMSRCGDGWTGSMRFHCSHPVNKKRVSEKVSATGSGLFHFRTGQNRPGRFDLSTGTAGALKKTPDVFCVQPVLISALFVLLTICVCPSGTKRPIRHSCVTLCVSFVLSVVLRRQHTTLIERNARKFRTNDIPGVFRLTHKQTTRLAHPKVTNR